MFVAGLFVGVLIGCSLAVVIVACARGWARENGEYDRALNSAA
jgi:hypothetical protein